jgi:hypothetical protein
VKSLDSGYGIIGMLTQRLGGTFAVASPRVPSLTRKDGRGFHLTSHIRVTAGSPGGAIGGVNSHTAELMVNNDLGLVDRR